MIVVDASVASKWFLREVDTPLATTLLEQPTPLIAPALVRLEVFSAISKAVRTERISRLLAEQYCKAWTDCLTQGAVGLIPDETDIIEAVHLSLEMLHSVQDCLYLVVAKRLQVPLASLDKKLSQKAQAYGIKTIDFSQNKDIKLGKVQKKT